MHSDTAFSSVGASRICSYSVNLIPREPMSAGHLTIITPDNDSLDVSISYPSILRIKSASVDKKNGWNHCAIASNLSQYFL